MRKEVTTFAGVIDTDSLQEEVSEKSAVNPSVLGLVISSNYFYGILFIFVTLKLQVHIHFY